MKRQRLIFFLFLLVGMGFLNYPFVSQWVNQRNQSKVIYEYEKKAEKLSDTGKQKLLGEARNYNSKLRAGRVLPGDSFGGGAEETSAYREYQKLLDVSGDGILCYLEIPSIEVFLPVFHGTSEHVLEQGAGHLFGSSLPVGGGGDTCCDRGTYRNRDQDVFYRSGSDEDGRSFFPECSGRKAGVSGGPDRYRDTGPHRSSADRRGKGSGDTGDLYSLWDQLTQASCKRKEDSIPGSTETCRTGKRIRISDLGKKSFCTFHTVSGSSRILAP